MSQKIADLVGLKKVAELRQETFNRKKMPWFQGLNTFGVWRAGELVEITAAYTKLRDEKGEFSVPNGHLCYFVGEENIN